LALGETNKQQINAILSNSIMFGERTNSSE